MLKKLLHIVRTIRKTYKNHNVKTCGDMFILGNIYMILWKNDDIAILVEAPEFPQNVLDTQENSKKQLV